MLRLFSVSLPRAGHHVAEMVLGRLFGGRFAYCEFYTIENCCKSIPCRRISDHAGAGALVFMQKSHDHDLSDPADPAFDGLLVQVREPVARALSNYELDLRTVGAVHSPEYLRFWLGLEAAYTVGFIEKWCAQPDPRSFILKYEDLLSDPVTHYRQLFQRFGMPMEAFDGEAVIAAQLLSSRDRKPFKERDIRASIHFDDAAFGTFQRLVAASARKIGYAPRLDLMRSRDGSRAMGLAFEARQHIVQGRPQQALDALAAYLAEPDAHPFARLMRAPLLLAEDRTDAARADLEAAIAEEPSHPRAYVDLALLLQEQRDVAGAEAVLETCLTQARDPQRAGRLILKSFDDPVLTATASSVTPKPAVTREEVFFAFRFILGREPESEAVIEAHRRVGSAEELREILLLSQEFEDKYRLLTAPPTPGT